MEYGVFRCKFPLNQSIEAGDDESTKFSEKKHEENLDENRWGISGSETQQKLVISKNIEIQSEHMLFCPKKIID